MAGPGRQSARAPESIEHVVEGEPLIEGEDPLTEHASDAAHWMAIYRELISFQEDLMARLGPSPGAAGRRGKNDAGERTEQLLSYRERLDFWYRRHWELHGLAIDPKTHIASHRDLRVHLTRREYQLLSVFLTHPNRTFAATELAQRAWTDARLSADQVRIYVARLRRRLADLGMPCRLLSEARRGYTLICA